MKTLIYTTLALIAFAGNSVLCRLALGEDAIDAASFTAIRLLSGVLVLSIILKLSSINDHNATKGSWKSGLMLFLYAVTFSYAYISLETATGALILFATVQFSMVIVGWLSGKKLQLIEYMGLIIAFIGFIYLLLPDLATPSALGLILMTISGIAWSFYTLAGIGSSNPLGDTAYNFLRSIPFVILLMLVSFQYSNLTPTGIILAALSGALTSALGYTVWYMALRGLTAIQAAVLQLLVPVIAALGGVLFVNEILTSRLIISSILILGGILTVILGKYSYQNRLDNSQ